MAELSVTQEPSGSPRESDRDEDETATPDPAVVPTRRFYANPADL